MAEMLEEVSNFDQDIEFVEGFAGSGKSTELASRATNKTLVMTPTHKAAGVLIGKGVKAFTIHSILQLVPTINENFRKGQKIQTLRKIGDVDLSAITDVFIDEFSMINQSILDMLLEMLPDHCKVTVFGDPYQLPPVSGDAIESDIYTNNVTRLTTQHRADNPEIVETFMRFMNYIRTGDHNISLVVNLPKGNLKDFNPDTDRILAYTNNMVLRLNSMVGEILGLPDDISQGENILVNDMDGILIDDKANCDRVAFPGTMSKGKMMSGELFDETSYKILDDIRKYKTDMSMYKQCVFEINGINYIGWYDYDHYNRSKMLKDDVEKYQELVAETHDIPEEMSMADWCRGNKGEQYVRDRAKAWSRYIAHQNLVFNLRRPFATTVHKAQGQEFTKVYIAQTDIKRAIRNGYYDQYARLMYVALSRAIHEVIII